MLEDNISILSAVVFYVALINAVAYCTQKMDLILNRSINAVTLTDGNASYRTACYFQFVL